jgi:rhomboid protease GluP
MYALYIFGPELERFYGHLGFTLLYLVSGMAGVVASFALTASPSLGASGAIFGLLGANAVFAYRNRELFGSQAQRALRSMISIALVNLIIGLTPGIDNWGHLGGLMGGAISASLGGPVLEITGTPPVLKTINKYKSWRFLMAAAATSLITLLLAAWVWLIRS